MSLFFHDEYYNSIFKVRPDQRILTPDEKAFLLYVERGDVAQVKRMVKAFSNKPKLFDINCMDPLGRTGLIISIGNQYFQVELINVCY